VAVSLQDLIERLQNAPVLNPHEAQRLYHTHTTDWIAEALATGTVKADAALNVSILNQHQADFRSTLRAIDSELSEQILIVNEALDIWFSKGSMPPPYYAWRIAIILAKAKRMDEEKAFLAGWCHHFGRVVGGRYEALAHRARKRGLAV
jgi:hypothetical protein